MNNLIDYFQINIQMNLAKFFMNDNVAIVIFLNTVFN